MRLFSLRTVAFLLFALCAQSCSDSTAPSTGESPLRFAYTMIDMGSAVDHQPHAIIRDSAGGLVKDLGIGAILWSVPGKLLVAGLDTVTDKASLKIYNASGTQLADITPPKQVYHIYGVLSQNATRVAYGVRTSEARELYLMEADGKNNRLVTDYWAHETTFALSPTGDRFAFIRDQDGKKEVCVIDVNSMSLNVIEEVTNLSPDAYDGVTWSPVGNEIVYRNNRIIRHHDLTTGVTTELQRGDLPAFTQDGKGITFTGIGADIYLTKDLGVTVENLTNTPDRAEGYPSWSPDGSKMLFLHWAGNFDQTTGSLGILDLTTMEMKTVASPAYVGHFVK